VKILQNTWVFLTSELSRTCTDADENLGVRVEPQRTIIRGQRSEGNEDDPRPAGGLLGIGSPLSRRGQRGEQTLGSLRQEGASWSKTEHLGGTWCRAFRGGELNWGGERPSRKRGADEKVGLGGNYSYLDK